MIGRVSFGVPNYSQNKIGFKANPDTIAKKAIAVDLEDLESMQDFMNTLSKEKPETLRIAAEKVKKQQPEHPAITWLSNAANTLEKK